LTDLFEDVEEQLRAERYRTLFNKAWPWVAGVIVAGLVVAGAWWGYDSYRTRAAEKASEQYVQAMVALEQGQKDQGVRILEEVAKSPSKAYKSMALMQIGGIHIADNKPAEAVKVFDEAAKAAPDDIIGDLARLKSAFALLDTAPYAELETRLMPLTDDKRPYRVQAREALAFAKLMKGDTKGARQDFKVISQTLDAPQGARERAGAAVGLIDSGSAKAIPATAKGAMTMPPMLTLPPGLIPPGAPQPQAGAPQ
jgi:hypothetical protein